MVVVVTYYYYYSTTTSNNNCFTNLYKEGTGTLPYCCSKNGGGGVGVISQLRPVSEWIETASMGDGGWWRIETDPDSPKNDEGVTTGIT